MPFLKKWKTLLQILAAVLFLTLSALFIAPELDEPPVTDVDFLEECYNIEKEILLKAWKENQKTCEDQANANLAGKISALIGPVIKRCQVMNIDKILYYNRKKPASENCTVIFNKIEKAKKYNRK